MEMSDDARNVSISLGLALSDRMRRRASNDELGQKVELLRLQLAEVLDLVKGSHAAEPTHQAMELLMDLKRACGTIKR